MHALRDLGVPGGLLDAERGLCENCAPDLAEEAASAQARVAAEQVNEKLRQVDQVSSFDPNMRHALGASCPGCSTKLAPGAKFCAGCGKPVVQASAAKHFCTGCGTELPADAKFCSGCGTAAA